MTCMCLINNINVRGKKKEERKKAIHSYRERVSYREIGYIWKKMHKDIHQIAD